VELTAGELASATDGEVLGSADARARSFTIDSRELAPGACFIAVRDRRDGHDFVADAFARGATMAMVEHTDDLLVHGETLVRVKDTMTGLSDAGRLARDRLRAATVVGITGSAGKTATKDLTAAALARTRRVHASPGSYNNEAGVPLTLLDAPLESEVIVAEMGARFAGNIADLAEIARPEIGVITHIGLAHAGHLGGREGITRVKGELMEALPASGLAVLNAECDATPELAKRTDARVVLVGRRAEADYRASDIFFDDELRPRFMLDTPHGSAHVALDLRGDHQIENAMQAIAVAAETDVPLEAAAAGVADARAAAHRMEILHAARGVLMLNDAYNSSPTSAAAAVRAFAGLAVEGRRVAVLGDMLELGDQADEEHAALGALVASSGVDVLVAVGEHAERIATGAGGGLRSVHTADDAETAAAIVVHELKPGDAVLVKASRAVGLERVVQALIEQGAAS
jgi:UDP-N-acetylmuramoyl-tripeptide--D-alanyl-D-alanine ligase